MTLTLAQWVEHSLGVDVGVKGFVLGEVDVELGFLRGWGDQGRGDVACLRLHN